MTDNFDEKKTVSIALGLINKIENGLITKSEFNSNEKIEIEKNIKSLNNYVTSLKAHDYPKTGFIEMHLYRLKLIFSRKLKEKSRTKSKLYKMHAFYGNMVIDEKSEIIREKRGLIQPNDKIEVIINGLNEPDLKIKFNEYNNLMPCNFNDYIKNYFLHNLLHDLIDEYIIHNSIIQNDDKTMDDDIIELRKFIDEKNELFQNEYLKQIIELNPIDFKNTFFEDNLTLYEIDCLFRKYSLFLNPDNNQTSSCFSLFQIIYQRFCETKDLMKQMIINMSFDDYYAEAKDYTESALDYYYTSKGDLRKFIFFKEEIVKEDPIFLKNLSIKFFKKAYENFKAACLTATYSNNYLKLIECHIKASLVLYMAELYKESKLALHRALYFIHQNARYNYRYKIREWKDLVAIMRHFREENFDIILKYLECKYDEIPKEDHVFYMDKENYETWNLFKSILKESSIFLQFDLKQDFHMKQFFFSTNLVSDTIEEKVSHQDEDEVLRKRIALTAGMTVATLSTVGCFCDFFYNKANNLLFISGSTAFALIGTQCLLRIKKRVPIKKDDEIKEEPLGAYEFNRISEILSEAQTDYIAGDHRKFLETLSQNYDTKNHSLISIIFDDQTYIESISIIPRHIIKVLYELGYHPHFISGFFVKIIDALLDLNFSIESDMVHKIIGSQNIENSLEISELVKQNFFIIQNLFWWKRRSIDHFIFTIPIAFPFPRDTKRYECDEKLDYLKEKLRRCTNGRVDFFTSKYNEIKNIGIIYETYYLLIFEIRRNNWKARDLNYLLEELKFNKNYITESCLIYETIKDYLWLFALDRDVLNNLYDDKRFYY